MENWVKVLEFDKKVEDTTEWLFKLLEDYVPKEYKEKVESYLKEYNNPNNIVYEEAEELRNTINDEDGEERKYNKRNIAKKIVEDD